MNIYTVESTDRIDYDFSFEQHKAGCFYDKNKAIKRAKDVFEDVKKIFAEEMKKYDLPDDEPGALWIEEDDEHGYYCISFGEDDTYESHQVSVEEWIVED